MDRKTRAPQQVAQSRFRRTKFAGRVRVQEVYHNSCDAFPGRGCKPLNPNRMGERDHLKEGFALVPRHFLSQSHQRFPLPRCSSMCLADRRYSSSISGRPYTVSTQSPLRINGKLSSAGLTPVNRRVMLLPWHSRKKATTIALDPEDDRLLSRAARERGVSRSEFIRQHLALVLEQYRRHPRPRSAGIVRALTERGDECELFGAGR